MSSSNQSLNKDAVTAPAAACADGGAPLLTSQQLFVGRQEIVILHRGECYRLRETRLGKLILTK